MTLAFDRAIPERDKLAFDFSEPNRSFDKDGRLHVKVSNLTKANVCEYLGSEIPNAEALGLSPTGIYKLWRHPEELQKAVSTANNIQLLQKHIAVSADDPKKSDTVGSTGTDAAWNDPYITNSLVVWDAGWINGVVSKRQTQLSSSYYYTADMTPGSTPQGERYDGVMRDISFNHVALVELGRAGSDVIVGDSAITLKEPHMIKRKAVLAAYAESAQLAADAALAKVPTDPTFKPVAAKLAKDAARAKLAADKAKDEDDISEDDDMDDETEEEKAARLAAAAKDKKAKDKAAKDKAAKDKAAKDKAAKDEDDEDEKDEDEDEDEDDKKKPRVDDKAMDAAIQTALTAERARAAAVRKAEQDVQPFVGKLTVAMDSAEKIYSFALTKHGIAHRDVHPSAYASLLGLIPRPGQHKGQVAMDAASVESFEKRFPDAARITQA